MNKKLIDSHSNWYVDPKIFYPAIKKFKESKIIKSGSLQGVSITSRTGAIDDGFNFNVCMATDKGVDLKYAKKHKVYHFIDYNKPTSLCTGKVKDFLLMLQNNGLHPTRARLSLLPAHGYFMEHTDAIHENQYAMKLHVPVITNDKVILKVNGEEFFMEEGKVYLLDTNSWHSYTNNSDEDRWHFICDVWDTKGNFSFGKCLDYQYHLDIAEKWRNVVDGITDTDYLMIEK
jgi:hypothetical protein